MLKSSLPVILALILMLSGSSLRGAAPSAPIQFDLQRLPFRLENSETPARNAPESMPGGLAIFDYNSDGRPDIFFTNGANIATLKKDDPRYRNRLFRNDGEGKFTDVTDTSGLAGSGYDIGAAVADYDNDGHADLFVAGLHHSTLYHNNGNGTFTDVTVRSGLDASLNRPDPQYGPLWAITGAWVDVNNDGLLALFSQIAADAEEGAPAPSNLQNLLKYEKTLKNLHLQEARLHRRFDKDLAELRELQQTRMREELLRSNAASPAGSLDPKMGSNLQLLKDMLEMDGFKLPNSSKSPSNGKHFPKF